MNLLREQRMIRNYDRGNDARLRPAWRVRGARALAVLLALCGMGILPVCAQEAPAPLPLGSAALPESREQRTLAPGVTLTTIVRGAASPDEHWTLQVLIPGPENSFAAFASREAAQAVADTLQEAGFAPVLRQERHSAYQDLPAGAMGYAVRVGRYAAREEAGADMARLSGMGFRASPLFTGEDGDPTSGPWRIRVLTIDPRTFRGTLTATHGNAISGRTRLTTLAQQAGALAAINAGYFVMLPSDGVPGEPAGLFIERGKVLSEATNGRMAMSIFQANTPGGRSSVRFGELATHMHLMLGSSSKHPVDGINRKPGVIRNCGGSGDTPSDLPKHDFTCGDPDEIVVLTPEFGAAAPAGDGMEAVVDAAGIVTELRSRMGGAIPPGGMLVQATGAEARWLETHVAAGARLRFQVRVADARGRTVHYDANDSAVNGGPGLVMKGTRRIHPVADGLVHAEDPAFFLRWGIRRNPRTMAGVDRRNRVLLVTVDGRQPGSSLGLSLEEGAQLMIGLGAVTAMNLDGGGSTAMAIEGSLINVPSEPAGERAIGDALIVK